MKFLLNTLISAAIISLSSVLAEKRPGLAGLVVAIPIATLTALALTQMQVGESAAFPLAKSIFLANLLTLSFFLPFLIASKFQISFWTSYAAGIALVLMAYAAHGALLDFLFSKT
jgi:hypothetical protein